MAGLAQQEAGSAGQERYSIVLSSATSLAALKEWFDSAAPGDRATYATGLDLPREHESVRFANELVQIGLAHLTQRRDPNDRRRWLFEITRAEAASDKSANGAAVGAVRPDLTAEQMRCLMRRLREVAAAGSPCPSYAEMARHLAMRGDSRGRMRARYLVNRLEKEKQITVKPGASSHPPVITILARGKARGKSTASISEKGN